MSSVQSGAGGSLESWAGIDLPELERGIQEYPGVFEEVGPAYVFKDARHLSNICEHTCAISGRQELRTDFLSVSSHD